MVMDSSHFRIGKDKFTTYFRIDYCFLNSPRQKEEIQGIISDSILYACKVSTLFLPE
jgi:hypothetical protein